MTFMDWIEGIRKVKACSAAIRGRQEAFALEVKTLLEFLDHEDVLVAFAAKEELQKALISDKKGESRSVKDVVNVLVLTFPAVWSRESSGFRFQLLRELIKTKGGGQPIEDGGEGGSSEEKEDQSGCIIEESHLEAAVENLDQVGILVRSVFMSVGSTEAGDENLTTAHYSAQYEALMFLGEFVKRLHSFEIEERFIVKLGDQMMVLMEEVFVTMDYESQPTFVSCAVLGLLGDFLELMKYWKPQTQVAKIGNLEAVSEKWLDRCLVWVTESPCTPTALKLLNDNESSNAASREAFIANSSRYPFLQQWLLCLTRMGVAFLEISSTWLKNKSGEELHTLDRTDDSRVWSKETQIPSRQQLFAVLAEQDDVMIEVLNGLTRMAALVSCPSSSLTRILPASIAPLVAEMNPDLLFADLVDTIGRDHLVLLDLLVSNETQALEYLMRYLRYLSTRWNSSKQTLLADHRLESVMSVLIRLRLEINRLVRANLIPYNAGPLTRRLLVIEQMYEGES